MSRSMWRNVVACFVVATVLPTGCGGDPEGAAPRPSPTPAEPAAPVNGGPCPDAELVDVDGPLGCLTSATADGATLHVFARLKGREPRTWWLRFDSAQRTIEQRLDAGHAFSYPHVAGAADVDADGDPDWWVKVADFTSHGAPWSSMNVFVVAGKRLAPLSYEGAPLGVNYGGIARLGEGARCAKGRLILRRAEAQDRRNRRWRISERFFHIQGAKAHFVRRRTGLLEISGYNDPDLDPFYEVSCRGFVYPPR